MVMASSPYLAKAISSDSGHQSSLYHKATAFVYAQLGLGIVYSDAYEDLSQSLIGSPIEFTPQFSVGAHYLLNKNWSIDGEAIFHHISNAGIKDRNVGVNAS
ncbi:MAG: acyloxyacyl hydrolase [Deltaproteobacteria bacterium]|jgi:hypothetical protein